MQQPVVATLAVDKLRASLPTHRHKQTATLAFYANQHTSLSLGILHGELRGRNHPPHHDVELLQPGRPDRGTCGHAEESEAAERVELAQHQLARRVLTLCSDASTSDHDHLVNCPRRVGVGPYVGCRPEVHDLVVVDGTQNVADLAPALPRQTPGHEPADDELPLPLHPRDPEAVHLALVARSWRGRGLLHCHDAAGLRRRRDVLHVSSGIRQALALLGLGQVRSRKLLGYRTQWLRGHLHGGRV
mmetsp:Transcript_3122/g.6301  ORF Transcript_3122/g.6301 Transcript_3122/m.6301 type:complete len:245 (+) Transcript_3122:123-857(+)